MSFRLDILKSTLDWAQKLDETTSAVTVRLDDKAQQTGAMAGIFLAAAFGFVKPENISTGSNRGAAILLAGIIIVFLLCLAACLSVTWLRNAPLPLSLTTVSGFNDDLLDLPLKEMTEDRQESYYRDQISLWKRILEQRTGLNRDKAHRLLIAQALLAAGMLEVSVLLFQVVHHMHQLPATH